MYLKVAGVVSNFIRPGQRPKLAVVGYLCSCPGIDRILARADGGEAFIESTGIVLRVRGGILRAAEGLARIDSQELAPLPANRVDFPAEFREEFNHPIAFREAQGGHLTQGSFFPIHTPNLIKMKGNR